MRRILLAGCLLLALTSFAVADPATIGALIVGSELAATGTGIGAITVGQVVGYAALTAASVALSIGANALLSKPQQDATTAGQFVTRQPTPSRRRNYGRVKVGGATIFAEAADITGPAGLTLVRLIAINEGEIDAFEEFWLDDNHVTLSGGTSGTVATHYIGAGPTPFMAIETRLGATPSTAYSTLTTDFASIWTSNHRGDGIASLLVMAAQTTNPEDITIVYPGGSAPNPRVVMRALKVWDPREGGQDKDDASTWEWSDNPVLIVLDFHRHADGMGLAARDATLFTTAALTEDWIPAANICDESVGGVTRYKCGGNYSIAEDTPADVLAAILVSCDGRTFLRSDGAIGIRVGKTVDPSITLDDDHIVGYSDLREGANIFLEANEITAKYTSPDHDYQVVDAEPFRDEDDITDRGYVLTKAISLPWVQNHSQTRRLMKIALARANPEWQGSIITDMAGLQLINERYVHLTINEVGIPDAPLIDGDFEILPDAFRTEVTDKGIRCVIGVASISQDAYDWVEADEAGDPPAIPSDE